MRFPFVSIFILALPFLEIAGFVVVGRQIGVLATLALVVAAAMLGVMLIRYQGFGLMNRIRREMDAGRDPGREMANGAMVLLAGLLLLIPGFVTDILALLLLLPPVRGVAWRLMKTRVVVASSGFEGFSRPSGPRGKTIDLDAEDYSHESGRDSGKRPQSDSPWRRIDRS